MLNEIETPIFYHGRQAHWGLVTSCSVTLIDNEEALSVQGSPLCLTFPVLGEKIFLSGTRREAVQSEPISFSSEHPVSGAFNFEIRRTVIVPPMQAPRELLVSFDRAPGSEQGELFLSWGDALSVQEALVGEFPELPVRVKSAQSYGGESQLVIDVCALLIQASRRVSGPLVAEAMPFTQEGGLIDLNLQAHIDSESGHLTSLAVQVTFPTFLGAGGRDIFGVIAKLFKESFSETTWTVSFKTDLSRAYFLSEEAQLFSNGLGIFLIHEIEKLLAAEGKADFLSVLPVLSHWAFKPVRGPAEVEQDAIIRLLGENKTQTLAQSSFWTYLLGYSDYERKLLSILACQHASPEMFDMYWRGVGIGLYKGQQGSLACSVDLRLDPRTLEVNFIEIGCITSFKLPTSERDFKSLVCIDALKALKGLYSDDDPENIIASIDRLSVFSHVVEEIGDVTETAFSHMFYMALLCAESQAFSLLLDTSVGGGDLSRDLMLRRLAH